MINGTWSACSSFGSIVRCVLLCVVEKNLLQSPALIRSSFEPIGVDAYKKCCKYAANFAHTRQFVVSARSWVRAALALRQLAMACRYRSAPCVSFSAQSLT